MMTPEEWHLASDQGNRRRGGLRLCIVALVLTQAACGKQPADMAEMSKMITATLAEGAEVSAAADRTAVGLSAGFGPAVRAAVEANEGYHAAIALEAEAMGRVGVAKSARRPQASGMADIGSIRETGGSGPDSTTSGIAGGVTVSQLIYDGGESMAAVNQATAEALAAQAERDLRGNELALEAARAWIDVWQSDERLGLLRTRTGEMDALLAQIERMASNGMIDRAALDSARRQIVDIALEETRLEADLREAQVRFQHFYNRAPGRLERPSELITSADARAAAGSWRQAPALERAAAELLLARNAVTAAEASFRPRARLQAGLNSPMQEGESTDTTVGLVVEYTFGDGGRRKSQLESAQARAEAVDAQLTDAKRTLEAEIDALLAGLTAIDRSMPLVAEQIRLSMSEAETARSQIVTAQSNLRELIEAEIENYRAQDRQIAMRAERQLLLMTIAARTGELGRRLGLAPDSAH